jgi:hypothetical protein
MFVHLSSGMHMTGQTDGRTAIPMPMVYEDVPQTPAQWEYRVLTIDTREEEPLSVAQLNELGSEGWLLIGVLNLQERSRVTPIHYYFVRQKLA